MNPSNADFLARMEVWLCALCALLPDPIARILFEIANETLMRLYPVPPGPPRPGPPTVTLIREEGTMLVYNPNPPADTAADVAKYEFTAVSPGVPDQVVTQDKGGAPAEIKFSDNAEVDLTCVEIDDSDNRSPASPAFHFTAKDTIAPGAPDAPSVTLVREE